MIKQSVLFLDRDGVINQMVAYPGDEPFDSPQKPEDVVLVDGIIDIIKWANDKNIPVVEITNQPGVAKGKMDQSKADAIESRVHQLLSEKNVFITKTYICPHHPRGIVPELTQECLCRKPKPGLLLQAASELNIDLSKSIFLGDGASDVEAGLTAKCQTIIYIHNLNLPKKVEEAKNAPANFKTNSLSLVIPILEKFFS